MAGRQRIPFEYSYGRLYPTFYGAMRDHKKFVTVKCGKCGRAILPPRPYCGACFADARQWVELPRHRRDQDLHRGPPEFPGQPKEASLLLRGGRPGRPRPEIHHLLEGVDYNQVRVGMRVKAVREDDRRGTIWDIKYFKPLSAERGKIPAPSEFPPNFESRFRFGSEDY